MKLVTPNFKWIQQEWNKTMTDLQIRQTIYRTHKPRPYPLIIALVLCAIVLAVGLVIVLEV